MVYIINFPRPIGIEPKIYQQRPPDAVVEEFEVEPGHFMCDPWADYKIIEFESEFLARQWVKTYYPSLYKDLEVVENL